MPEAQVKLSATRPWTRPTGTLGAIVTEAASRVEGLARAGRPWRRDAELAPPRPPLHLALRGGRSDDDAAVVAIIAEVKRHSPSKGVINAGIDAGAQASAYVAGGAAAISVLTEPVHFGGTSDDLATVVASVDVPVIKKDFHVDPIQLYEARVLGASAALLIARALEPSLLREMLDVAAAIGLETIVEVRDEAELELALDFGARIVGVNNRNLETLVIDPDTVTRLIPRIPHDIVAVAESGMQRREDVRRAAEAGADAVLIGSAVSAAPDPAAAVAALANVSKRLGVRLGVGPQ